MVSYYESQFGELCLRRHVESNFGYFAVKILFGIRRYITAVCHQDCLFSPITKLIEYAHVPRFLNLKIMTHYENRRHVSIVATFSETTNHDQILDCFNFKELTLCLYKVL